MTIAATERVLSDKLCECGCGERTYIARRTDTASGKVKGEPLRYRSAHGAYARDLVPVAPLREAFERSGLTPADVARGMDWWDHRGRADSARVNRALGFKPQFSGKDRRWRTRRFVTYDTAVRLARALDVDPWEAGL